MSVELVTLADGRSLEVSRSGAVEGPVCLFHHGTPGSALVLGPLSAAAAERGLQLVGYSRAGYGGSTRLRGRSVGDIAGDMRELLDHLGAARCVTFGWSGGGPHTLATAALLPDRIAAVASVAGVKPFTTLEEWTASMGEDNVEEFGTALKGEEALTPALIEGAAAMRAASVDETIQGMASLLPSVDREALAGLQGQGLVEFMSYGLRQADGWIDDDLAFVRHWGFELADITCPAYVWQGSEDLMVPLSHADGLEAAIGHPGVRRIEGAGHISLLLDHIGQILDDLKQHL